MSSNRQPPGETGFPDAELAELVQALIDGDITDAGRARLAERLKREPEARRAYVRAMQFEAMLQRELPREADDEPATPAPMVGASGGRPARLWFWRAMAAAAAVAAGIFGARFVTTTPPPPALETVSAEEVSTALATVVSVPQNGVWLSGRPAAVGQQLSFGNVAVEGGPVQIAFSCGAIVTLAPGSELQLQSETQACLTRGRLRAYVPPEALGFLITTPNTHVLDLGTEFGLDVPHKRRTEVHVIEGAVEAKPLNKTRAETSPVFVGESQAIAVNRKGVEPIAFDLDRFVLFASEIPFNPISGVVHWSFDRTVKGRVDDASGRHPLWARVLEARENLPTVRHGPGVFGEAADLSEGSFFLGSNSHGIVSSQPRSVAFWIKLPPEKEPTNILNGIVGWGMWYTSKKWQVMWNINPAAGTVGAIRVDVGDHQGYIGSTDLRDGRWHHIAVVCLGGPNASIGTSTAIYVDGKLDAPSGVSSTAIDTDAHSVESRPITIGRFVGYAPPPRTMGYLKGMIDELYVFDRALRPEEVKSLMKKNRLK